MPAKAGGGRIARRTKRVPYAEQVCRLLSSREAFLSTQAGANRGVDPGVFHLRTHPNRSRAGSSTPAIPASTPSFQIRVQRHMPTGKLPIDSSGMTTPGDLHA